MVRWRNTPFPWYDDIGRILGEQEPNGEHAWFGGEDIDREELELDDDFPELPIHPRLLAQSTSASQTPSTQDPSTPAAYAEDEEPDNDEDEEDTQNESRKRHRESAQLGINMSKKQKVSGASAIDKIGEGINNLAEAFAKKHTGKEPSQQVIVHQQALAEATVGSTLQGLATQKVQEEACLTLEGQLFMLDLLEKEALARTYVALESERLRVMWLRKQLQQHGGDLSELFIGWEDSQH